MTNTRAVVLSAVATAGCVLATLWAAASASARFIPDPPTPGTNQLIAPPPASATNATGTSPWWFVLVATAAVATTLLVVAAVHTVRNQRAARSLRSSAAVNTGGDIHVNVC
jgi:hypothetical protein